MTFASWPTGAEGARDGGKPPFTLLSVDDTMVVPLLSWRQGASSRELLVLRADDMELDPVQQRVLADRAGVSGPRAKGFPVLLARATHVGRVMEANASSPNESISMYTGPSG